MSHEEYMHRCFTLAQKGLGHTSLNPLVGAVVVHEGKIIAEGYHEKFGEAHAEVNAIDAVENKGLLGESTLYISLEPCSHHGKTPPCSELIIKSGIPKVVIANLDPLRSGIEDLEKEGIEVTTRILEKEGRWLNRRFFTHIEKKRPYIILKFAQSADGFVGTVERRPIQVTHEKSQARNHLWRSQEDAIMVGTNTAINDNPSLTVRKVEGRNPVRITIDPDGKIPSSHQILDNNVSTIVYQHKNLDVIAQDLYEKSISSLIVEGGPTLQQSFLDLDLWDEIRVITSSKELSEGTQAIKPCGKKVYEEHLDEDFLEVFVRESMPHLITLGGQIV